MLLFWFVVGLLVVATLAVLIWPLLRKRPTTRAPDDAAAAIAVYRDQKRALDAELASGAISASERDSALADLSRRVAEDVDAPSAAPAQSSRLAWWLAIALLLLIPSA